MHLPGPIPGWADTLAPEAHVAILPALWYMQGCRARWPGVALCWQLMMARDEGCSHAEAISTMGAHVTVAGYLFSLQWYKCSLQNSTFPATANENTWCIYAKAPSHSW